MGSSNCCPTAMLEQHHTQNAGTRFSILHMMLLQHCSGGSNYYCPSTMGYPL